MADAQIAIIDGDQTQVVLAPGENPAIVASIPGPQGPAGAVAAAIDGSAALPSIAFASDTDTGLYRVGANQLGVSTGGTQRLVIDSNGQIEATSLGTAASPTWTFVGDPNTGIYSPGADQLALSTGGTGRLFVDASGNVGVGLSSPAATFGKAGSVDANGILVTRGAINAHQTNAGVFQYNGNETTIRSYGATAGTGAIVFNTGGGGGSADTERLRITSAGLVGIGTSSPLGTLSVGNHDNTSGQVNDIYISGDKVNTNGHFARLMFRNSTQAGPSTASVRGERESTNFGTALTFYTQATNAAGDGVERLRIDSSGRVGIGTTPDSILHVLGPGGIAGLRVGYNNTSVNYYDADTQIFRAANATERVRITSTGLVGIGTSAPVQTLTVASNIAVGGSGNNGIEFYNATPTATALRWFLANNSGASDTLQLYRYNSSGGYAGAPVCVDSSGRVGIGTTSPSKRFTILQDGADSALRIEQSGEGYNFYRNQANGFLYLEGPQQTFSGFSFRVTPTGGSTTNAVWIDNSGRVGIGTTSPDSKISIGGTGANRISFSGSTGQQYVGFDASEDVLQVASNTAIKFQTSSSYTERARIDSSGRLLVGTNTDSGGSKLQINDNRIRIATAKTPASATDTGVTGEICWDANYVYVCTATNTWKRTALATW